MPLGNSLRNGFFILILFNLFGLVILTDADTTDEQFFLYYFIVHFESTWRKHGEFVTYNAVLQQHTGQNADVCIHLCLGRLLSGPGRPLHIHVCEKYNTVLLPSAGGDPKMLNPTFPCNESQP